MPAQKQSFVMNSRYVRSMLNNSQKYMLRARRGCLVMSEDFTGLKAYGSQALLKVFNRHRAEFEAAAREDTKLLGNEDITLAKAALPATCSGGVSAALSALYRTNEVPRLPYQLVICNEPEMKGYLCKLIREDIVENGGRPTSRIAWGKPGCRPSFWPEDVAPWEYCRSPGHSQEYDFGMPFVEVMKEAARRALTAKGLDWREHYDKDCDKDVELRRLKSRGMHLDDMVDTKTDTQTEIVDIKVEP